MFLNIIAPHFPSPGTCPNLIDPEVFQFGEREEEINDPMGNHVDSIAHTICYGGLEYFDKATLQECLRESGQLLALKEHLTKILNNI